MGSGRLLGIFGIVIYVLFTLLPDSSTEVVRWPWVIIWQAGLLSLVSAGMISLWRRDRLFFLLGNKLDWGVALYFVSLCLSTIFAEFSQQALWYSLIGFSLLIAIYVANNYLQTSQHLEGLLTFQGILSLIFILESLTVWLTKVLWPEMARIGQLRNLGINATFDFSNIELRNAAPIGHQNYVAGFLMLAIPLLISLAIAQSGIWRKIWIAGAILGAIDLYTTSSRGGILGLTVGLIGLLLVLLVRSPKYRLLIVGGGGAAIALVAGAVIFNNRLLSLVGGLLSGRGSNELFFRMITSTTGLKMGLSHLPFGVGPGLVGMYYQQYRPVWAEREAEMVVQLHSTPAQLWAELGIGGVITAIAVLIALVGLFIKLHSSLSWQADVKKQVFTYGLFGGLLSYGVMSLTDYQLDIFAISGFLVISLASIAYIGQQHTGKLIVLGNYEQPRVWLATISTAFLFAAIAWLMPIDAAWHFSGLGFNSLAKQDTGKFVQNLERSHALASWESYYPYQLGWNLAFLGTQTNEPKKTAELRDRGLEWIEKGIKLNPNQEFGYNTAAWLSLNKQDSIKAEKYFKRALELIPNKRSLNFGLGISLLQQNKTEAGIDAITQELFNDPIFITSPIWNSPQLQSIYAQVTKKFENLYGSSIYTKPIPEATRTAVRWWIGAPGAIAEMSKSNSAIAVGIAAVAENKQTILQEIAKSPLTPWQLAIAAWLNPAQRQSLIEKAFATATLSSPDEGSKVITNAMLERMNQSLSFDAWLRAPLPANSPLIRRYFRQRAGFNILSRHMDGSTPQDFFLVQENAIISLFFSELFRI